MKIKTKYVEVHLIEKSRAGTFRFLLLKRSFKQNFPGLWQMVTGKIARGEKAYETAIREIKEETGLMVNELWIVPNINSFYLPEEDAIIQIPVFLALVPENFKVALSSEHIQYKWVEAQQAIKMLEWPGQKRSVKIIEEYFLQGKFNNLLKIEYSNKRK